MRNASFSVEIKCGDGGCFGCFGLLVDRKIREKSENLSKTEGRRRNSAGHMRGKITTKRSPAGSAAAKIDIIRIIATTTTGLRPLNHLPPAYEKCECECE